MVFSKITERFFYKIAERFLQNADKFSPKSPNKCSPNHRTRFLQIANVSRHTFSPNRRTLYSKFPRYFTDQRATYFLFCSIRRRPSLRSLPTRATGSVLCVMGGRLWFLGHACSSYTCMGSTLDVMDYGLARAKEFSNELTTRTLLILCIIALGLTLQRFFHRNTSKLHKHAHVNIYTYT